MAAPDPLKFFQIFNILGARMQNEPSPLISMSKYNQELFIAIFWEESFFRNMVQDSGWDVGRSIGFGQVQRIFINSLLRTDFKDPKEAILRSDALSVDLSLKAMLEFDRLARHNKLDALKRYAGGKTPNWIKTSDELLKIPPIASSSTLSEADALAHKDAIIAALSLCRKDDTMAAKIF
jgi:hypothetical protein